MWLNAETGAHCPLSPLYFSLPSKTVSKKKLTNASALWPNETALSTSKVLLVPYSTWHVPRYHEWMQDEVGSVFNTSQTNIL